MSADSPLIPDSSSAPRAAAVVPPLVAAVGAAAYLTLLAPNAWLVLLTDGVNNVGAIDPLMAAEMAKTLSVRIYTVGVGRRGVRPDPLDEETLIAMATQTGGYYFRATDRDSLREAFRRIDALEKTEIEVREYHSHEERFASLALCSLILVALTAIIEASVLRRLP